MKITTIQKLEEKTIGFISNVLILFLSYFFASYLDIGKNFIIIVIASYTFYVVISMVDLFMFLNSYLNVSYSRSKKLNFTLDEIKKLSEKPAIYKLDDITNRKTYIGKTNNLRKRLMGHFRELKNSRHINVFLQESYNNGSELKIEIIEIFDTYNSIELTILEHLYIKKFKSRDRNHGYNLRD